MKKIIFITLLSSITLLNSNTIEQTKFMQNMADRANSRTKSLVNLPRNTTRVSKVKVRENYTLDIYFKTNFSNMTLVDDFKKINEAMMKKKFCRNRYYKRMKDGFIMKFNYYTPKNKFITSFQLKRRTCEAANSVLNNLNHNISQK